MITHIRRSESHGNKTLCGVEAMRFFCADHGDELSTWDSVDDGWCPACLACHETGAPPKKYIAQDSRAKDRHIQRVLDVDTLCGKPALASVHDIAVMTEHASLHPYNWWCPECAIRHLLNRSAKPVTPSPGITPQNHGAFFVGRLPDAPFTLSRDSREQGPSAASQARDVLNPESIRKVDRKQPILNEED